MAILTREQLIQVQNGVESRRGRADSIRWEKADLNIVTQALEDAFIDWEVNGTAIPAPNGIINPITSPIIMTAEEKRAVITEFLLMHVGHLPAVGG